MTLQEAIEKARREGRNFLTEVESKALLTTIGVRTTAAKLAASAAEACAIADEIGFPVALKISSPDITHKTDVGGVKLNLRNTEEVVRAFDTIIDAVKAARPDARIEGVTVQEMAPPGTEVIVGMTRDPSFGPLLMFGLGGVMVELMKDVSFRLAPLTARDASAMIREIKGYPLLDGYRGQHAADTATLEQIILKVADFVLDHPEIKELDLNPIFAYPDGAIAVDARFVIS